MCGDVSFFQQPCGSTAFVTSMESQDSHVWCGIVCFSLDLSFFISVGSQSRQNHTRAEEFHTSFTVFCLLLSVLLCRHRVQDLLPCGQQGPTALDHGRGGLQRPTVHRHGSFCWADLRVQTHRSHGCGLGWATGSSGCYHRAERSVWYYIIIVSQL